MTTRNNSIPNKQFTTLAFFGLLILVLFGVGFLWLVQDVLGNGEGERFLSLAPFWVYPYMFVNSIYVGFLSVIFARGRWNRVWLWGMAGFASTLLFILALPSLLSPLWPYQGPEIFAGPAIFAFLAPVLSALLLVILISAPSVDVQQR